MLKPNFHTHTFRCKHARGDVEDYCREARSRKMDVLGFTDHTPMPDGRWQTVRMPMEQLPGYCEAIDRARDQFPQLRILKGMECEFDPGLVPFYADTLLGQYALDYLIAGAHWYPHEGEWTGIYGVSMDSTMLRSYTDYVIASIQSGLFAFIAHPDLFGASYLAWDNDAKACGKAICQAAAEHGIPLEINGYGLRKPTIDTPDGPRHKYPWRHFWEMAAQCKTPVVISSDAHTPEDVNANLDDAAQIAAECGLQVVDPDPCPTQ